MVRRRLAKKISLHLVQYLVRWHQKMLHVMESFPQRLVRSIFSSSSCTSLEERDFQPFHYQCLEMAGRKLKYSASRSCQRHRGCEVIPQRSFGPQSKKKGEKNPHFCIGPAPDMQAKLSALWIWLLCPPSLGLQVRKEHPSLLWPRLAGIWAACSTAG